MDITQIIRGHFQIDLRDIDRLRFHKVESTLNTTVGLLARTVIGIPIEENTLEIWVFGGNFFYKFGNLVQCCNVEDFGRDLAIVFVGKFIEMLLSAANSNNMRACLRILFSERETDAFR